MSFKVLSLGNEGQVPNGMSSILIPSVWGSSLSKEPSFKRRSREVFPAFGSPIRISLTSLSLALLASMQPVRCSFSQFDIVPAVA